MSQTREEVIKQILEMRTLFGLSKEPRNLTKKMLWPDESFKDFAIFDVNVLEAILNDSSAKKELLSNSHKNELIDFAKGLKELFLAHNKLDINKYDQFIFALSKLIRASLERGEYVPSRSLNASIPMKDFLKNNPKILNYLKQELPKIKVANEQLMSYLKKNEINYLPKRYEAKTPEEGRAIKEAAALHLKNAKIDNQDKEIELKKAKERAVKIDKLEKQRNEFNRDFIDTFKEILNTGNDSKKRNEAIEKLLKLFDDLTRQSDPNYEKKIQDTVNFFNITLEMTDHKTKIHRNQLPFVLFAAIFRDPGLDKEKMEALKKLFITYSTSLKERITNFGIEYMKEAIKNNDARVLINLLALGVPMIPLAQDPSPFELASNNPAALEVLNELLMKKLQPILTFGLKEKYNTFNPSRFYKDQRLGQIKFLEDIQKALLENDKLNSQEKALIYLGSLHYIKALLIAEHKDHELNWRWTDTPSNLEKLLEQQIKQTEELLGIANQPQKIGLAADSFLEYINQNLNIESKALSSAYHKYKEVNSMHKREAIYQNYLLKINPELDVKVKSKPKVPKISESKSIEKDIFSISESDEESKEIKDSNENEIRGPRSKL